MFLGKTVHISGWGADTTTELEYPVLREGTAAFVNTSVCLAHLFDMYEGDLCMSGINGAALCFSDAGGPVVASGKLVAMLAPRDYECGRWRSFAVVNLSRFAEWIEKHIREDEDETK